MHEIAVRPYQESDASDLVEIYYNTIHQINCRDYTQAQIDVWASEQHRQVQNWKRKWDKLVPFVAIVHDQIVGFVEFEENGHIDCFYCHHDWIGKGIGTKLMQTVLQVSKEQNIKRIYAEVSITAKLFFLHHGFKVIKRQTIERQGVSLDNFIMERILTDG